jgi:hypothetical protein
VRGEREGGRGAVVARFASQKSLAWIMMRLRGREGGREGLRERREREERKRGVSEREGKENERKES